MVLFLGTGSGAPPPGRAGPSLLVEAGDARVLLDCGPGCSSRLREAGYKPRDIDVVYITHLHMDHWAGLFELAVYAAEENQRLPQVAAAEPVASQAEGLLGLLPSEARAPWRRLGGRVSLGALTLTPMESRHSVPCYGALLEAEGVRVLYTSDTAPTSGYAEAAGSVDLLVTEATMPSSLAEAAGATGHQTVEQALSYAARLPPQGLLALVHLSAGSEAEALRRRARRVLVPRDLTAVSL